MTQPMRIAVAGAVLIGQAHIKRILEEPEAELARLAHCSGTPALRRPSMSCAAWSR
jgi:hypothetical protein